MSESADASGRPQKWEVERADNGRWRFGYGDFPASWGLPPSTAFSPLRESWIKAQIRKQAPQTLSGWDALLLLQRRKVDLAHRRAVGDPAA